MTKNKIIKDFILSIIASLLPIVVLQFVIFPSISLKIAPNKYGEFLTMIGLVTLISGSMGTVLNNIRLINIKKYKELKGDFSSILLIFLTLNGLLVAVAIFYYREISSGFDILLLVFSSFLIIITGYSIVAFRIELNYKNILYSSVYLSCGYIVGYFVFLITNYWGWIYFIGNLFYLGIIIRKSTILKEPFKKTRYYKATLKDSMLLLFSTLLLSGTLYIDRLLIYPLLGGLAVSVYYTATLLPKTLALILQPLSSVLLSYLAHLKDFKLIKYIKYLVVLCVSIILSYYIIVWISEPILTILYPQFVKESILYVKMAAIIGILSIVTNLLNPIVLKFYHLKWQLILNSIFITVYSITSISLGMRHGVIGFFYGGLIANSIKLILLVLIVLLSGKNIDQGGKNNGKNNKEIIR
ncbi:lipopolysaccharide biosynthesis protein [Sporosarcina sp. OR05]|uniref:lipopolysaccharide biosynthesis protein n=1 Tax=Sporosarcina sp. OR05 TaxID=2969819 RepID=UPI00352B7D14